MIARETTDLSVQTALFADRLIAATPQRIGQVHAARLVHEARLYFDPDRALADEEAAAARRGAWLRHGGAPATTDITMTLDTPDALLFDQTITRIAGDPKDLGDIETLEVRRARAVGILADPNTPWTCSPATTPPGPATVSARVRRTSTCTSLPQTWPPTTKPAPVPSRSSASAPPPPPC